jgi:hypothetical protein
MIRQLLAWLLLLPLGVAACEPEGQPALRLERDPGEFVGAPPAERVQRIAVFANGCLLIDRPGYFREAGRFVRALDAPTLANLRAQAKSLMAKGQGGLQAQLAGELDRARQAKALTGEVLPVINDADRIRLWLQPDAKAPSLQLDGLLQKAEAMPDAALLNASAVLVQELLRQAEQPGRIALRPARPATQP